MTAKKLEKLPASQLTWDLIGPTVDDDVRRLIWRHGADAVKAAVDKQTKPKKGRKPELDWPELLPVIEADARVWLSGGDPFSSRSNYSIANGFASRKPGQSHTATQKRIERKLGAKREFMTLISAMRMSRENYPYMAHIRALQALSQAHPDEVWKSTLAGAHRAVADYEAKIGTPPPPDFSLTQIEELLNNFRFVLEGQAGEPVQGGLGVLTAFNVSSRRPKD
jgi:hypothetical protein